MSDQSVGKKIIGGKALEMVMRDVLYGMEDLATRFGYNVSPYRVEILSVDADHPLTGAAHAFLEKPYKGSGSQPLQKKGVVIDFPQRATLRSDMALRKKIS